MITDIIDPCYCNGNLMVHEYKSTHCGYNESSKMTYYSNNEIVGLKTQKDLERACLNIGYDITCGECASRFYTGTGGYAHSEECKTLERMK